MISVSREVAVPAPRGSGLSRARGEGAATEEAGQESGEGVAAGPAPALKCVLCEVEQNVGASTVPSPLVPRLLCLTFGPLPRHYSGCKNRD